MISFRVAILVLVAIPTLASAQRRRTMGEPEANWREVDQFSRSTSPLTVRDIENLSAVKVLIDQRKKLKLSDEQSKQLNALADQEKEANKSGFQAVDTLRRVARARQTAMTEEETTLMSIARADLRGVIDTIRASYVATLGEAMAVLDESQREAAKPLLEKHRDDSAQLLRAKFAEMSQARPAEAGAGARRRP
ncbi:MAG: hypothetical protein WD801_03325 [Gemmatimonadaceae bacterium]